jgi:hypothetical protein
MHPLYLFGKYKLSITATIVLYIVIVFIVVFLVVFLPVYFLIINKSNTKQNVLPIPTVTILQPYQFASSIWLRMLDICRSSDNITGQVPAYVLGIYKNYKTIDNLYNYFVQTFQSVNAQEEIFINTYLNTDSQSQYKSLINNISSEFYPSLLNLNRRNMTSDWTPENALICLAGGGHKYNILKFHLDNFFVSFLHRTLEPLKKPIETSALWMNESYSKLPNLIKTFESNQTPLNFDILLFTYLDYITMKKINTIYQFTDITVDLARKYYTNILGRLQTMFEDLLNMQINNTNQYSKYEV